MIIALGGGMLGTLAMFTAADRLTGCRACFGPADGGPGSLMAFCGVVLILAGAARRPKRPPFTPPDPTEPPDAPEA